MFLNENDPVSPGMLDSLKAGWDAFKNTAVNSSAWKAISSKITGLGDNIAKLGNYIGDAVKNHKGLTAAGLAGAGLLGTYYLYKKFKEKKTIDNNDKLMAMKLDKMRADQIKNDKAAEAVV